MQVEPEFADADGDVDSLARSDAEPLKSRGRTVNNEGLRMVRNPRAWSAGRVPTPKLSPVQGFYAYGLSWSSDR